jgi:hypothetical protein
MKNSIRGNYHHVSPNWLQGYINEFVWRDHRADGCEVHALSLHSTA